MPCSSGSAPVITPSKKDEVGPSVTPSKKTNANKRSRFTRFISTLNLDKDKIQIRDKDKTSPFHTLPHIQESPKGTGENMLERLLSEAAEEASARIQRKSVLLGSENPPNPVTSTKPQKALKQMTPLPKRAATNVEKVQTPPKEVDPVSKGKHERTRKESIVLVPRVHQAILISSTHLLIIPLSSTKNPSRRRKNERRKS